MLHQVPSRRCCLTYHGSSCTCIGQGTAPTCISIPSYIAFVTKKQATESPLHSLCVVMYPTQCSEQKAREGYKSWLAFQQTKVVVYDHISCYAVAKAPSLCCSRHKCKVKHQACTHCWHCCVIACALIALGQGNVHVTLHLQCNIELEYSTIQLFNNRCYNLWWKICSTPKCRWLWLLQLHTYCMHWPDIRMHWKHWQITCLHARCSSKYLHCLSLCVGFIVHNINC